MVTCNSGPVEYVEEAKSRTIAAMLCVAAVAIICGTLRRNRVSAGSISMW